jgi:hypothetical protein
MSQTFFTKLEIPEKNNRLGQLVTSKGNITVWLKGKKEKKTFESLKFDKDRQEVVLDTSEDFFVCGTEILCTFEIRGMIFFSQVIFKKNVGDFTVLHFNKDLFKSERRSNYRLLTYPLYEVWSDFDLGEKYEGSNVIDMNRRSSQTKLFHSFIKLASEKEEGKREGLSRVKIRVQDISVTGMAIHIGELESKHFTKEKIFKKVFINFPDQLIEIPEVQVVYVVDYISSDKNIKRYKVGCCFTNLSSKVDDILGRKINALLRENDSNKDFETFLK